MPEFILLGGPAGAGKSTLARAWAMRQTHAVVVELDDVRDFILGGRADPQVVNDEQERQYLSSVRATAAAARAFHADGYSVSVVEVFPHSRFDRTWATLLTGIPWKIVVVRPSLEVTLSRSRSRTKKVHEEHSTTHHAETAGWPAKHQLDTTALSVEQSLAAFERLLGALP